MKEKLTFPGSLHNHSDFSNFRLRDSINTIEALVDRAIELGQSVVAITDHETIASAVKVEKYYKKIKKDNPDFKVIRGNEIYLVRNGLNAKNFNKEFDKYYHFILLAKDAIGHEQIREISSRAWNRSYTAQRQTRVPTYYQDLFDIIGKNPGHVVASTACLGGALGTQLLRARQNGTDNEKIKVWCRQLESLFGKGNFYLEMQPSHNEEQIYVNNEIIKLSEELDIPFIITTDSHYLKKEDIDIHNAFLNAQQGERETKAFYATTYLMSTEEIYEYMEKEIGEENLQKAFKNILDIQNKCEDFSIMKPLKIPRLAWKKVKDPAYISVKAKEYMKVIPELEYFYYSDYEGDKRLAEIIVERIVGDITLSNKETYDEINACLEATRISSEVNNTHWSAYYLNLQAILDTCWEAGTLIGPGRGSGVGFILLYLLDITQINPLREKTKTFRWRFLNPARVSVLDVDIDIEGGKRQKVLHALRNTYGDDRVANVLTLRTEKSKQAILTAARGLGIDVDTAQYLSSMIVADRGQTRTLSQTFYGDEENGFAPNQQFRHEMEDNYPELWEVAQYIEGLICGVGVHAGGVIFVDEPFHKTTALMKSPKGETITQFDLHDAEETGLIKYDLLSIEALDKMHICLDLLIEGGYVEPEPTLKETYEKVLGIYNIERDDPKMWKMCWNHDIMSLFQMEQQSGIQGIALTKPESVDDLATLNSVIRLMAQEKGGEQPLEKYARFKEYPDLWYDEMYAYGLTKEEQSLLEPILKISYGICESQERFMQLVQIPECGGFDLNFADKLRKSIAKKNPKEYEELTRLYFQTVKEKGLSERLCNYVWNVLIAMSRGYGFNLSHTLAYSLIALQEMNLAYRFPIIFWDCANLIADSGGAEMEEEDDESDIFEAAGKYGGEEVVFDAMEDFGDDSEDEECSEDECEDEKDTVKKKKSKTTDFGKIATAIGKMKTIGIEVAPPDINHSNYTFTPDVENNAIRYGLSGMTRIGENLISNILENRPYESLVDFTKKVNVSKPQMVNLIKSGAFDRLCGNREQAMKLYIGSVSDQKKRVTLQNMKMLIEFGLIPEEYEFEVKVFNYNKYLKKHKDGTALYFLDSIALVFYEKHFDMDDLLPSENSDYEFVIRQTVWDKKYKKCMDRVRDYIKANHDELLAKMNNKLISDMWNKYCAGSISKWEMDSVSCYFHPHELSGVRNDKYGIKDYFNMPENPQIDRVINIKGKEIPLFKITRIAGTVLDRNKSKNTVTLLTESGVVTVKIYGAVFAQYDKQISERGADGKKHVIEKSWLSRGNKIIVTGIRRGDMFLAKKYNATPYHLVELITDIKENGNLVTRSARIGEEE